MIAIQVSTPSRSSRYQVFRLTQVALWYHIKCDVREGLSRRGVMLPPPEVGNANLLPGSNLPGPHSCHSRQSHIAGKVPNYL